MSSLRQGLARDLGQGACISVPSHGEVGAGVIRQIVREFPDAPKGWR